MSNKVAETFQLGEIPKNFIGQQRLSDFGNFDSHLIQEILMHGRTFRDAAVNIFCDVQEDVLDLIVDIMQAGCRRCRRFPIVRQDSAMPINGVFRQVREFALSSVELLREFCDEGDLNSTIQELLHTLLRKVRCVDDIVWDADAIESSGHQALNLDTPGWVSIAVHEEIHIGVHSEPPARE